MRSFALTYPQLMNQGAALGLAESRLRALAETYRFAEEMSDGLYRAQQVPLVCHLVRTSSILIAEEAPFEVVQAGMLHATGVLHLFEDSRRRAPLKRKGASLPELKRSFGDSVHSLVVEFAAHPWDAEDRLAQRCAKPTASLCSPEVRLIRLANELEDLLDLADAYSLRRDDESAQQRYEDNVAIAEQLGRDTLADDLREAWALQQSSTVAAALRSPRIDGYERARRHFREASLVQLAARFIRRRLHRARRSRRGDDAP